MKDKAIRISRPTFASSFRLHPFLNPVYPSAFRRFRLVSSRKPIHIFARTIALHQELRFTHVLKLNLYGVPAIHRPQALVKRARRDNIPRIQTDKPREPGDLIRDFVGH